MRRWVARISIFMVGIIFLIPHFTFASISGLTIHSFQTAGESAYDEFVSIKNDSATSIDITNYSISRKTKSATSWNTLYKFIGVTIAPHQEIVVSHAKYTGVHDYLYSTSSYSLTSDNSIAIIAPDKSIVDLVGYGEAGSFEGALLPNPAAGEVYIRNNETNNNLTDFASSVQAISLDVNSDKLVISELLPNPSEGEEWVELFNPTNLRVNLGGLKLCDAIGSVHCYYFPNTEVLGPFEYKIYSQSTTKITLNNTGDWAELRDGIDNVIADTGGNYGDTDAGISLSLFGSDFQWTKAPTPNTQNIYVDIVEVETSTATPKKASTKKVSIKASVKGTSTTAGTASTETGDTPAVVSDNSGNPGTTVKTSPQNYSQQLMGFALISFAVLLFLGYNLWERRDYAKGIYNKIIRRDR